MKRLLVLLLTIFALNGCEQDTTITDATAEKQLPKVDVCHYDADTDTWKTININRNALKAHLGHGDYEGECSEFVDVCHYDKNTDTWETISISENQLAAHLDHGDYEGDCDEARTYVPNDFFEWGLIYWGYDDVMDDYVLTANIRDVENLGFDEAGAATPWDERSPYYDYKGITDFTGLEGFRSLKRLGINRHQFYSLDLSKNPNLESLGLNHMYQQVEPLDLSNNLKLKVFSCMESNSFNGFDLSSNVALEVFYLERTNGLNYINLKNGNNSLITQFYIDGVDPLTCIQVDDAEYSTSKWGAFYNFSEDCGY